MNFSYKFYVLYLFISYSTLLVFDSLFMDSTILLLYYYYKCVPAGVLYLYSYFSSPSNLENWELKADQSRIEGRNPG